MQDPCQDCGGGGYMWGDQSRTSSVDMPPKSRLAAYWDSKASIAVVSRSSFWLAASETGTSRCSVACRPASMKVGSSRRAGPSTGLLVGTSIWYQSWTRACAFPRSLTYKNSNTDWSPLGDPEEGGGGGGLADISDRSQNTEVPQDYLNLICTQCSKGYRACNVSRLWRVT